ncbi:MAG: hypothetical protein ACQBVK_00025 [Candidatus Phytoplasma sp. TWB_XP]
MQNQKTQKSLVAKVLVLFAAVALMFVGVQVFADSADLTKLKLADGKKLTLTAADAFKTDAVVAALKNAGVTVPDSVKAANVDAVAGATQNTVKLTAKSGQTDVTGNTPDFTYELPVVVKLDDAKFKLQSNKKLALTVEDAANADKVFAALKKVFTDLPESIKGKFDVTVDKENKKVTVKAKDDQRDYVTGQQVYEFAKTGLPLWVWVLGAVLVVTAVAGSVFFFVKKNKNKKNK